jgi:hypothetical protein
MPYTPKIWLKLVESKSINRKILEFSGAKSSQLIKKIIFTYNLPTGKNNYEKSIPQYTM